MWDLEVIAAEKQAWVDTMLLAAGASATDYLASINQRWPEDAS